MLGVPGVYIDSTGRLYTNELEQKYGLCFNFSESTDDQQLAIDKGIQLLQREKRTLPNYRKMLNEHIDPTVFLCWFVENYPESERTMRTNPDYQSRFK